jgi:hypothetical protein
VAVGLFAVLLSILILGRLPQLRPGLPSTKGLMVSIGLGLALTYSVTAVTGCNNIGRWPAIFDTIIKSANATPLTSQQTDTPVSSEVKWPEELDAPVQQANIIANNVPVDTAISQRIEMWIASLDAIQDSPLIGHGALALKPIIQEPFGYEHNHNQYLAWLVTGGIIFLILGIAFICTPLFMVNALVLSDKSIAFLSVTFLWGVSMLFDAFLSLDFYLHYFSLLLGFLFALFRNMTSMSHSSGEQV